ncbi:metal-sensing transcriptional repressor [Acidaminobacter sp.]|uniref:metal-sensing transcriptional repressor n=1 Tax=Acidaminobacter sp. TaxID=1872102 RepID=UPI00255EA75E|nr:metal-sensing transcriptional repressor [Acidaminobacter sp.]MDK9712038.1 metal-sensing transcriptional repressor [Acidaminobacter sp.]
MPHAHKHTETKNVVNRLSRAIGHLESVKKMVIDGKDCTDILIQLSAVTAAINNTGKIILVDHIRHCVADAVENDDQTVLDQLEDAIHKFIR